MNDKIKEIAKQAGLSYLYDYDADGHAMVCSEKDIEKFADLMLKASFDAVINDGRFHDAKGIIRAAKYTAMEHFGVEDAN